MDYFRSLWYYDEKISIISSELKTCEVPKMTSSTNNITYPTRLVTGCNYTRMETYMKTESVTTTINAFNLYQLTVIYTKEGDYKRHKMMLIFNNERKAEDAKLKLHGQFKLGVWMGGYYIPEINYYSYRDNYFATMGALTLGSVALLGIMSLCFHFAYKE